MVAGLKPRKLAASGVESAPGSTSRDRSVAAGDMVFRARRRLTQRRPALLQNPFPSPGFAFPIPSDTLGHDGVPPCWSQPPLCEVGGHRQISTLNGTSPHFVADRTAAVKTAKDQQWRPACRKFLDTVRPGDTSIVSHGFSQGHYASWVLLPAFGDLRGVFGIHLLRMLRSMDLTSRNHSPRSCQDRLAREVCPRLAGGSRKPAPQPFD
jgi:hypothetical protein